MRQLRRLEAGVAAHAASTGWPTEVVWRTPTGDLERVQSALRRRTGKPYHEGLTEDQQEELETTRERLKQWGILGRA